MRQRLAEALIREAVFAHHVDHITYIMGRSGQYGRPRRWRDLRDGIIAIYYCLSRNGRDK